MKYFNVEYDVPKSKLIKIFHAVPEESLAGYI
jgi:hypothetical protein